MKRMGDTAQRKNSMNLPSASSNTWPRVKKTISSFIIQEMFGCLVSEHYIKAPSIFRVLLPMCLDGFKWQKPARQKVLTAIIRVECFYFCTVLMLETPPVGIHTHAVSQVP